MFYCVDEKSSINSQLRIQNLKNTLLWNIQFPEQNNATLTCQISIKYTWCPNDRRLAFPLCDPEFYVSAAHGANTILFKHTTLAFLRLDPFLPTLNMRQNFCADSLSASIAYVIIRVRSLKFFFPLWVTTLLLSDFISFRKFFFETKLHPTSTSTAILSHDSRQGSPFDRTKIVSNIPHFMILESV